MVKSLVFIDSSLPDVDYLLEAIGSRAIAVVIDGSSDGIKQMAEVAAGFGELDSIELYSHGGPGRIRVGNTELNTRNLSSYQDDLSRIGASLRDGADILLYGCDVAGGVEGTAFIDRLATLTGADVAASTDATGSTAVGGDWVLEASTGSIEASPVGIEDYGHLLALSNETLTFLATNANLWSNGAGFSVSKEIDTLVFHNNDISVSGNPTATIGGTTLGVDYAATVSGVEYGFPLKLEASAGVFNLNYPVNASIAVPSVVKAGSSFTVATSSAVASAPTLKVDGPSINLALDAVFKANIGGHLGLEWSGVPFVDDGALAVLGTTTNNGATYSNLNIPIDTRMELFSVTTDDTFKVLNNNLSLSQDPKFVTKLFRNPFLSLGYSVDLNALDGDAKISSTAGGLADFTAVLAQEDPLLSLSADIDDMFGGSLELSPVTLAVGTLLRRSDLAYKDARSFLGIDVAGTEYEASLLSIDGTIGLSPALRVEFDAQDVQVTLKASNGETRSGRLGDSFTFSAPTNGSSLFITPSYRLVGNVTAKLGIVFQYGMEFKVAGVEGQVFGLKVPALFPDGNDENKDPDYYALDYHADGNSVEYFPDFLTFSHAVSFDLNPSKSYVINYGDHTDTVSVPQPVLPPSLSVSVLGAGASGSSGYVVNEGNSGSKTVTFRVTRAGNTATALTASYQFTFGTEVDAADFGGSLPAGGALSFAAGEVTKDVTVAISGDTAAEADERVTFTLTSSATVLTPTTVLTIYSDDQQKISGSGLLMGTARDDLVLGSSGADVVFSGPGNDSIVAGAGNDDITAGAGNDTINPGDGSDTVDGGNGSDRLIVDATGKSGSIGYIAYKSDGSLLGIGPDYATIKAALSSADHLGILKGNVDKVEFRNIEAVEVTGTDTATSSYNDLLIAQGVGSSYDGRAGTDTFYADWSAATGAVVWDNDPAGAAVTLANGTQVRGVERLFLMTGGGNDSIANTRTSTGDWIDTGAGNDTINPGDGNDTVDGGSGSDRLIVNAAGKTGTVNYFVFRSDGNFVNLVSSSDFAAIRAALSSADRFQILKGNGDRVDFRNIEAVDVTGTSDTYYNLNDLLIVQGTGSRYDGKAGTDSFYADWSAVTGAVVWDNDPSGAAVTLANGTQVSGVERLLLATGGGNDSIANTRTSTSDWIDTGAGNDTINPGDGFDTVDGGSGSDRLIVNAAGKAGTVYYDVYTSDISYVSVTSGSSFTTIRAALSSADHFRIWKGNSDRVEFRNVEGVDITGTDSLVFDVNDLLIAQGAGSRYDGKAGIDSFYADWSAVTGAVVWDNNPAGAAVTLANGTQVSGVERLLLATGSGNDSIANTRTSTSDWVDTGAGNDTINPGDGFDTVDGGSGSDRLIVNAAGKTGTVSYVVYKSDGNISNLYSGSYFADIRTALSDADHVAIWKGGNDEVEFRNIEAVEVTGTDTATSPYNDLLIAQGTGSRYDGRAGTDTFYADWSAVTGAVVWDNDPAGAAVTLANGTQVSGVERLLLATGSGNDSIANTRTSTSDRIDAGAGDDTLIGGAGGDTLIGGAGNDVVDYGASTAGVTVDLRLSFSQTGLGDAAGDVLSGIENLVGSQFADRLTGDAGSNVLQGGAGDDTLNGGAGSDILTGGAGKDIFGFSPSDGSGDRIADFGSGDRIRVEGSNFSGGAVTTGTGSGLAAHSVQVGVAAADTILYIDADGIGGVDLTVTLTGLYAASNFSLSGSDILVSGIAPMGLALAPASDTGVPGDRLTNVATPVIVGKAEAGSTVKLYDSNGTTVLGTASADSAGSWAITSSTLANGTHTLTSRATDTMGNTSAVSTALVISVDTAAPIAPNGLALAPASDSGTLGDGITSVVTPVIVGNAETGSTVRLYDSDGTTILGTASVGNAGTWTIASSPLSSGAHTLTAKATDAAGNTSTASSGLPVTVDATVLTLGAGGNTIAAGAYATIIGGSGTDVVTLGSAGGTLRLSGVETLVGGAGTDVVALGAGALVWKTGTGSYQSYGTDGLQTLLNVEQTKIGGSAAAAIGSQLFDPYAYIASYGDLIKIFGLNAAAAAAHYFNYGSHEGRTLSFDALKYVASNPDLINAFGIDTVAAEKHFIEYGSKEGRPVNFDT
ncbi:DUF4347 domain-containing protein, partial [Azospirillum sp. 412522]